MGEKEKEHRPVTVKLWSSTRKEARIIAATLGVPMVALIDKLVKAEAKRLERAKAKEAQKK